MKFVKILPLLLFLSIPNAVQASQEKSVEPKEAETEIVTTEDAAVKENADNRQINEEDTKEVEKTEFVEKEEKWEDILTPEIMDNLTYDDLRFSEQDIERIYQLTNVHDQEMEIATQIKKNYIARRMDKSSIIDKWNKVNKYEVALLAVYYQYIPIIYSSVTDAENTAASLYPGQQADGDGDAFRHSYWNALMVNRLVLKGKVNINEAIGIATLISNAHEAYADDPLPKEMDLKNNKIGRDTVVDYQNNHQSQMPSENELQSILMEKIKNGKLFRIENDQIVPSGKREGWVIGSDGEWFYYRNSEKVTGWQQINGKWYLFNSDGIMRTGWVSDKGEDYYLNTDGSMSLSWQKIGSIWYYFGDDGAMRKSWQNISGKWYYFDSSGNMKLGWQSINNKWYHFNSDGQMETGWIKPDSYWYYLNNDGAMHIGWKTLQGKTYYLDGSGHMVIGSYRINGRTYNFNTSGELVNSPGNNPDGPSITLRTNELIEK